MSNKPNFRRREVDVLINYKIAKKSQDPVDIVAVLRVPYTHVKTHAVKFHMEPKMYDGVVLFSLIGFHSDQMKIQRQMHNDLVGRNCRLSWSPNLPVPK